MDIYMPQPMEVLDAAGTQPLEKPSGETGLVVHSVHPNPVGDKLYVGNEAGDFFIFKATPKPLKSSQRLGSAIGSWHHPLL